MWEIIVVSKLKIICCNLLKSSRLSLSIQSAMLNSRLAFFNGCIYHRGLPTTRRFNVHLFKNILTWTLRINRSPFEATRNFIKEKMGIYVNVRSYDPSKDFPSNSITFLFSEVFFLLFYLCLRLRSIQYTPYREVTFNSIFIFRKSDFIYVEKESNKKYPSKTNKTWSKFVRRIKKIGNVSYSRI